MEKPFRLRMAICDDMPADAALLQGHVENSGISAECRYFEDGERFIDSFRAGMYDLVFMDICLDGMSGVDVVRAVREQDAAVVIAFTTSSPDYTRESYQLKALKYIDKPVSAGDVKEAMELALMKLKARPSIALTLAGGDEASLALDSILYFEQHNRIIHVHTQSGIHATSQAARLDSIEAVLPSPPFLRCHNSFIVNLSHVHKVDREIVAFRMKSGECVYIRQRDASKCARYERELDKWRISQAERDVL